MTSLKPRRFGIELELSRRFLCINNSDRNYSQHWAWVEGLLHSLYEQGKIDRGWALKIDTSCGGEVVSPILHGAGGLSQVARICSHIQEYAYKQGISPVDGECGLHIHFDSADMKPRELSNLFILLHTAEPIIYSMYPNRSPKYCAPIELNMRLASRFRTWTDVRDTWYRGENNVRDRKQFYSKNFVNSNSAGDSYDGTRYHGFNIHCFWKQGTVEFRYAIGTLDILHIKAYYEMCLSMVNTAMSKKKIKLSSTAMDLNYKSLVGHYSTNYRFRKMINKLCKDCQFSRSTVKLIMDLVRKNKPFLLNKPPKEGDVVVIDVNSYNRYIYRMTDGIHYNCTGMRIPSSQLAKVVTRFQTIDCEYSWETLTEYGKVGIFSINPKFVFHMTIQVNATDKHIQKNMPNLDEEPQAMQNIWNIAIAEGAMAAGPDGGDGIAFNQPTETNEEIF